jgi:16S rRNA (cytosine967-C5)-methyltransferase
LNEERDRALVAELFYGILRNLRGLDMLVDHLSKGPIQREARDVLRLGLYQIFWTRVPAHAAVNETVELAGRARKLVNAVLRRALREREKLEKRLENAPDAVRLSHPDFLLQRWAEQWGSDIARQLAEWNNQPTPVYIRLNPLKEEAAREVLEIAVKDGLAEPAGERFPLFYRVQHLQPHWLNNGLIYVQDPSTSLAVNLLDPQPGETLLDAAAAPGGKTSYIAGLMQNTGKIAACDSSGKRLKPLQENLIRLGIENVQSFKTDWTDSDGPFPPQTFDGILLDAPCTNTGVMRRRIDVRYRLDPRDFQQMPELQLDLARKLIPLLKPGGRLIYSTCSLEPEENRQVVEKILETAHAQNIALHLTEHQDHLPWRDQTDGAYAAHLQRQP